MMRITEANVKKYAGRYNERYKNADEIIEKEVKKWLKSQRYLDKKRFLKIGLWKSKRQRKRYEDNDDLMIREITRFSFAAKSEEARIKSLLVLNGVSYPVASAILHFAFPKKYPIMDFRVIWSLGWKQPKYYTFDFWQKYCRKLNEISKKVGEEIRTVDKALWKHSKEQQKYKK